ncbi:MAG: hypothetical protein QNJ43_18770 [Breoghania sp.]|nr:hypothetical protein [Breoghania sp.]
MTLYEKPEGRFVARANEVQQLIVAGRIHVAFRSLRPFPGDQLFHVHGHR